MEQMVGPATAGYIYIFDYKIAKRELAWVVATIILGIVSFSLIIALAVQNGGSGSSSDGSDSGGCKNETCLKACTKPVCLGASAALAMNMNPKVSPCKDFYEHACGNFDATHPIPPDEDARGSLHDLSMIIEHALYRYLEEPLKHIASNSYEKKLKSLYQTCMDEARIEERGGLPLIETIEAAGGWNVFALKEGQSTEWEDFTSQIHYIMEELWTFPFMRFDVFPDPTNRNKRVVSIDESGIGMAKKWYLTHASEYTQDAYSAYMMSVANQLVRENGMERSETLAEAIRNFTEDAYSIELQIAEIMESVATEKPKHMPLHKLEPPDSGSLDVIGLASEIFKEAGLTSASYVYTKPSYVFHINDLVGQILTSEGGNRKLNNYLMWRVMDKHSHLLPLKYRAGRQEFLKELTGTKEVWSRWNDCINLLKLHMPHALSAIAVPEMKNNLDENDIDTIVSYMQHALESQVETQTFADETTESRMLEKLRGFKYELYDDHAVVAQATATDEYYKELKLEAGFLFEDFGRLNQFVKAKLNEILPSDHENRPMFLNAEYSILPRYTQIWNILEIPLGSLDYPFYHKDLPLQLKMGGLGHTLSMTTINMINAFGSWYDKDGVLDFWWSQESYAAMDKQMQCFYRLYNDTVFGPYEVDGHDRVVQIPTVMLANEVTNEIAAIRNAYMAYQEYVREKKPEPEFLAGIEHDEKQLFFLSYAHTKCINRRDRWQYNLATDNIPPEKFLTNEALSQMPEFHEAFQCSAGSDMIQTNDCTPPY